MADKKLNPVNNDQKSRTVLSWREERFITAYIDNKGNIAQAALAAGYSPSCARQRGRELATKSHIQEAIELRREEISQSLNFTREKWLRILIAQATSNAVDAKNIDTDKDGKVITSGDIKYGIDCKPSDRKAALDELRDVLGFNKESSKSNWFDGFDRLAEIISNTKKKND